VVAGEEEEAVEGEVAAEVEGAAVGVPPAPPQEVRRCPRK
jgi:hypothetical protein